MLAILLEDWYFMRNHRKSFPHMTIEDAVTPTSAVDGPSAGWTSIPRDIEEKQGSSTGTNITCHSLPVAHRHFRYRHGRAEGNVALSGTPSPSPRVTLSRNLHH